MAWRPSARRAVRALPWSGVDAARWLPAVLAAAAVVILGLPTLILPLHLDQALFAMVGRAVARGGMPYVDAWDFKQPSLYLVYAAAIHGPFGLMRNVRVFDLAWTAVSAALLAELGRRWWNGRAGLIAGLTFALAWSTATPWWQSAQPDSLVVLPLVLSLLLYESAHGRRGPLIAAGVVLGFAFQVRFNIALFIPFYPLVEPAAVASAHDLARRRLRRVPGRGPGVPGGGGRPA